MANIQLDLSGKMGLTSGHAGDADMITPRPELIFSENEGEMAGGLFNPYLRNGYLAPTTTTTVSISVPDTLTLPFTTVDYDPVNGDSFWSGNTYKIYKLTSLDDTSLATDITLDTDSIVNDLKVYNVGGKASVVYTYDYPTNTTDKEKMFFLGYKSLVSSDSPVMYEYDPIAANTTLYSFTIGPSGSSVYKLAWSVKKGNLDNTSLTETKINGVTLKLRRSTSGQAQTWVMKLSAYSGTFGAIQPSNEIGYSPNTLIASTTVDASVLDDSYGDIYFEFSTPFTYSSPTVFVLEPDVPANVTGSEGVEVLCGASGTPNSNDYRVLFYDDAWVDISEYVAYDPAIKLHLSESTNIINRTYFTNKENLVMPITEIVTSGYSASGNLSISATIGSVDDNIVIVSITKKASADEISGVTIGGSAMTLLNKQSGPDGSYPTYQYIYYKENAGSGSTTIATTGLSNQAIYTVYAAYGVKSGTISIVTNTTKSSGTDEEDGIGPSSISVGYAALYVANIGWKDAPGPDYYRIDPYSFFSYTQTDNGVSHGSTYQPMRLASWNAREQSFTAYIPAMQIKTYDNGSYDDTLDGNYNGILISVAPLDSTQDTVYYNTVRGTRSGKAFLLPAKNGFMYVFSDNAIHLFDGLSTGGGIGTFTKDVIIFPDYHTLTDAVSYRSRLYILVNEYPITASGVSTNYDTFSGRCGIYVWGGDTTKLGDDDYIEIPGVKAAKSIYASPDGQLRVITVSDNGITELRQFGYNDSGGVVFPVIKRLGIGAFPNTRDGVKVAGDKVIWTGNDGNMYCDRSGVVTKIFNIKTPGTTTATTIANITSGALLFGAKDETGSTGYRSNKQAVSFSYTDGTTHYVKRIYPFDLKTGANAAQTPNQGDVYTGVTLIPQGSAVRNVRIYNAPVSSTGSTVIATVKIYFNQSTSASMPSGMTKTITLNEAKRGYVDFHINKQYLHAIQIEVEWATGTPLGDDMYLPSVAVVTYDELKTQSPDNG